jgi:chemotaxis signal transduction protein
MRTLIVIAGASRLAVPLRHVREVHEQLEIVTLPRSGAETIGAAPVAGAVLPVVALPGSVGTAGPALVIDGRDGPFAWCVDRIDGLLDVDEASVHAMEATSDQPFRGVHEHDGATLLHVDLTAIEPRGFVGNEPTLDLSSLGHTDKAVDARARQNTNNQENDSVIVVRAASEVVAIPLADVFEIQAADSFVRLPVKDAVVVGLSMVRGNPTLALDLARLVGGTQPSAGNVVIVLRRPAAPVALRVDEVVGLRRYESADFVPSTTQGLADGFIVRGADGNTPLLIDVARTVDAALERHLQVAPIQRDAALVANASGATRRLVLVRLARETGAIAAESVERVVDTPVVTPLRSAKSPWLVGAVDVGGRVLPLCDVRRAFGAMDAGPATRLVLVRDAGGEVTLALAVDDVESLVSVPRANVEPFGFARSGPATGVVRLEGGRIASLLAPESLLSGTFGVGGAS